MLLRFLFLSLLLTFSHFSIAEENALQSTDELAVKSEQTDVMPEEQEPLNTIVHKVEKEIIPMPSCNDEKLLAQTQNFVQEYFATRDNYNARYRRQKHFVINNLHDFTEENIANYKSSETSPVSDVIIELKINEKIIEENMRLCKKTLPNHPDNSIYLLVYPVEEGYKVQVMNIEPDKKKLVNNSFIYEDKLDF